MRGALASIEKFGSRTVVVVGDLITDEYLFGKPVRISREAPVLILSFSEREVLLGGAANAANNVHALGARVLPIGVIGCDAAGEELMALFRGAGISTDGIVTENGRTTPVKTRIMAGGYQATRQQVVRLDREPAGEPQPVTEDALLARLTALTARVDAIVISDYGYGTVTPRIFDEVKATARRTGAIVSVDSRYQLPRFTGVTAATPNEAELEQLTGVSGLDRQGKLTLIEDVPTGGKEPRHFAIDPSGNFLLAENQNTNAIVEFRIDQATGKLTPTGETLTTPSPICLAFLPAE
jgi:rfaE bifunctional protein kinase chain/domain